MILPSYSSGAIKSKFHENKDWNPQYPPEIVVDPARIKSKFHENKDWNSALISRLVVVFPIKSKFHENKDWNTIDGKKGTILAWHQEQVPRKQGLKLRSQKESRSQSSHQEQVPRKQGLKLKHTEMRICSSYTSRASSTKTRIETTSFEEFCREDTNIKSKFHENKDWNLQTGIVSAGHQFIKSKFHENKDWN